MGKIIGQAESSSFTPEFSTQNNGTTDPKIPVFPPFLYAFHPARWNMVGCKVMPQLRKVSLQGGVNQVTRSKDGRWHIAKLRAALEVDGWTIIPYSSAPDGETYIKTVQTRLGNNLHTSHLSVWASTFQGSTEIGSDLAGYTSWLQSLIDDGTLPPCPEHIADKLLERYTAELQASEARVKSGVESFAAVVEVHKANVAALTKHLLAMAAAREDKKPRKRKPSKSKPAKVTLGASDDAGLRKPDGSTV